MATDYDDEYATCTRTFATLLMHGDDLDPAKVTAVLGLEPSRSHSKGQIMYKGKNHVHRTGFWSLSTQDSLSSRDLRRHLDWLLDAFEPRASALASFRESGFSCAVSCFWEGPNYGGPTFSPSQSRRLAALDLEFWVSFYDIVPEPSCVEARLIEPLTRRLKTAGVSPQDLAAELSTLYSLSAQTLESIEFLIPRPDEVDSGMEEAPSFDEWQLGLVSDLAKRWREVRSLPLNVLRSFDEEAQS